MADGIRITLEGFDKLDANLLNLSGPAGERIMRAAARAAGKVVQAAIVEAAPVRTDTRPVYGSNGNPAWNLPPGALKSDITLRVTKNEETGGVTAIIKPGKYSEPVARWVEYGHEMVTGGRKGKGKAAGFVPAHPFIRPALDLSEAAAIAAAEEAVADEVIKELRKMGVV